MFAFNNKGPIKIATLTLTFIFVMNSSPAPTFQATQVAPHQCGQVNGCGPQGGVNVVPNLWFQSACNNHDLCYGNLNTDRETCDKRFFSDMVSSCDAIFDPWGEARDFCDRLTLIYYLGVRWLGEEAFDEGQYNTREAFKGLWHNPDGITLEVSEALDVRFHGDLLNSSCQGSESFVDEQFFDVRYYTAVPGECRFEGYVHPISYTGDGCTVGINTWGTVYLWGNELKIIPASHPLDFLPIGFRRRE